MTEAYRRSVDQLYGSLLLKRKIVGVQYLYSAEEFEQIDAMEPKTPMNYCGMVKAACMGHKIKALEKNFRCKSGPRVMGINPSDPYNANGEVWNKLGLYADAEVSAKVRSSLTYSSAPVSGVLVQDIAYFDDYPDVVIVIGDPYVSMRVTQGYAYYYGMPKNVNLIGNQAICLECTARPTVTSDMNVSLLCIGTRHRAGWGADEMAVGIPRHQISKVADGIYQTVNTMESNENKDRILQQLEERGLDTSMIQKNDNYYMHV